MSIVFGPIPSRRLGRSLGINNIPPKVCSYSCVYCQLGNTDYMSLKRREFFLPDNIYNMVIEKVNHLQERGETIDYITFVPDGEPTIDIHLGETIERLKNIGIKIAVITNSSLIWAKAIQNDLMKADWVSLKVDSAIENIWNKIDRPHGFLKFKRINQGLREFASFFKGIFVTETMLIKDVNDNALSVYKTAEFIKSLNPIKAYLLVPTRPPAEDWVSIPDESELNAAFQIFNEMNISTELLIHNEGTDFTYTSDVEKELLCILAVHPMRKDAVEAFIKRAGAGKDLITAMIKRNKIKKTQYNKNIFYIKNIRKQNVANRMDAE